MFVKENEQVFLKIKLQHFYVILISILFSISLYIYYSLHYEKYNHLNLEKLFTYVEKNYKGEITREEIFQNAMKGAVNYLDKYSFSVIKNPKLKMDNNGISLNNSYVGLGISIKEHELGIEISEIFKSSDLYQKAEIGNIITTINKKEYEGDFEEFKKHLKGKKGEVFDIEIFNNIKESYTNLEVTIKEIDKENIEMEIFNDEILYIKIKEFTDNLNENLQKMIEYNKENIKDISGVIIDLAGNTGGLFQEGLKLSANLINTKEVALYSEYKNDKYNTEYYLENSTLFKDLPMVLIVDKYSASSSEIFAGIFKYFNRGKIIGQNTFGKGVGQQVVEFNEDFEFAMTSFEFFIGKEKVKINEKGIMPDITIKKPYNKNKEYYLEEAVKLFETNNNKKL